MESSAAHGALGEGGAQGEQVGHLAQRVALLSRVDDEPAAALLRCEHALHHAVPAQGEASRWGGGRWGQQRLGRAPAFARLPTPNAFCIKVMCCIGAHKLPIVGFMPCVLLA